MRITCAACGAETDAHITEGGLSTGVCGDCVATPGKTVLSPVPGEHPRDRGRTCMWCGARLEGFGHECSGCAASD